MLAIGLDLGGTKLSAAIFSDDGTIHDKQSHSLDGSEGKDVGQLVIKKTKELLASNKRIKSIGIAVPGIYHRRSGTIWAPNIPGWEDYPLVHELQEITKLPITIDSDRAAYILGEAWVGNAKGCRHAIYLAVGTGIGAGIMIGGHVLRGANDIAGAIGWMALDPPFKEKYKPQGCFEYAASGKGIVRLAEEALVAADDYNGPLAKEGALTTRKVFAAYKQDDQVAKEVFSICIRYWGMAVANLVSLFNPQKVIFGGGVFGPAVQFLPAIKEEAEKWAQPVSIKNVSIEAGSLGTDAGLYGAGYLAFKAIRHLRF
jgi:glucokinase